MADEKQSKRQIAYNVRVADVLNNKYVKEEGWLPNYVSIGDRQVSRVNILGVLVSKSADDGASTLSFILDDGSGRVPLRFFEPTVELGVGDIVTVIGRPREFGSDRYIVPEIIKKVSDPRWVEVRKLQLAGKKKQSFEARKEDSGGETISVETEEFSDEISPSSNLFALIKKLDEGEGVSFDEISVKFSDGDAEEIIKKLLEQGDIFEVKPGRYKVLE